MSQANTSDERAYQASKRKLLVIAVVSFAVLFGFTFVVETLQLQFRWQGWAMKIFSDFITVGSLATLCLCLYIVFMIVMHSGGEQQK